MKIEDLEKRPACEFERDEIVVRLRDLEAKISELPTNEAGKQSEEEYILEWAWGVISNASDGDWDKINPQWKRAAELWRDRYFAYVRQQPQRVKDRQNFPAKFQQEAVCQFTQWLASRESHVCFGKGCSEELMLVVLRTWCGAQGYPLPKNFGFAKNVV